jgi:hypothetical protein
MNKDLGVRTFEDCALVLFVGLGVVGAGAFLGRSLRSSQGAATP